MGLRIRDLLTKRERADFNKHLAECKCKQSEPTPPLELPGDWYVHECGQSRLHMLWYMIAIDFGNTDEPVNGKNLVMVEECDTFEDCVKECTTMIKELV